MSPIPGISGIPPLGSGRLIDALKDAGLVTAPNLALCQDFADRDCTNTVTPQVFTDLSGAGYTFWNGNSNVGSTFDMQWNGTPGALSRNEFMKNTSSGTGQASQQQLRGGINNPSWADNGHKNNAAFAVGGWFWLESNNQGTIFATSEIFWTNDSGWAFTTMGASGLGLYAKAAGSGSQALIASVGTAVSRNAWHYLAMSVDEANGSVWFQVDGTVTLVGPGAFSFDDTNAPDGRLCIGSNTVGHWSLGLNSRCAAAFGWSGVLAPAKMPTVYNVTRGRFA